MTDFYKCHFCPRNIKLHNIDKHFKIFHKFGHSDIEYYCEFCDSQEVFLTRDDLLEHIYTDVQHMAGKTIPESKMESLEEGKSKFLHLMSNFESQKDAIKLLFWIKCNDTKTFLDNHEIENDDEFQNKVQDNFEENEDQTTSDRDFTNSNSLKNEFGGEIALTDVIFPQEENFEDDSDQEITDSTLVTMNNPEIFREEFYNKDSSEEIKHDESDLKALLDYAMASDNENEDSEDQTKSEIFRNKFQESHDEDAEKMLENNKEFTNPDAGIQMKNCLACNKSFSSTSILKKHIHTIHEGLKDYKCEYCGETFNHRTALSKHRHIFHENQKDYKCESCGKSFFQAHRLKTHIYTIHEDQKQHECEFCSKSFIHLSSLKKHRHTIHRGQKGYKCESCGKSFSQEKYLNTHNYRNHVIHKCRICGKSFSQAASLKKHISEIHEGEKKFKCEFCSHKTNRLCELRSHIKCVHDRIKEHQCNLCGKYYPRKTNLRQHIKTIHEKQRNHKCDSCGKSFQQSGGLKTHIMTIHEGKRNFKCDSCEKSFSSANSLKVHIKGKEITSAIFVKNSSHDQHI